MWRRINKALHVSSKLPRGKETGQRWPGLLKKKPLHGAGEALVLPSTGMLSRGAIEL